MREGNLAVPLTFPIVNCAREVEMTASTSGPENASSSETVASELTGQAEAAQAEVSGALKQQGRQFRDEAKDEIQRFTDQRKQEAASFLKDVSNALRELTSKLDEQGHGRIARYAGVAADKLGEVGDDLPTHDLGELLQQIERMARDRPAVFIGTLFMAGFGAARFLRASGEAPDAESEVSEGASSGYSELPQEREGYHGV
jgi:gas vesicle protein